MQTLTLSVIWASNIANNNLYLMKEFGQKNPKHSLKDHGITNQKTVYWNLDSHELVQETLLRKQGTLTTNGALVITTGEFTGRSPKDRYIVQDKLTQESVDWNEINQAFDKAKFSQLKTKLSAYLETKELYIKDASICQEQQYALKVRLIAEFPWSAQFVHNMFVRLEHEDIISHDPEWVIYCAPGFKADPSVDGTKASNFSIINFEEKTILIGGSGYTGEIKKGIFSVLNFILPTEQKVLSMHCSANVGTKGDSAVFFGLSGTGKTTLSADPQRQLIGDDEHGWSEDGLFNFEGGCYAKCIGLTKEKEPDIYRAIKPGAILENIKFFPGTSRPNYDDTTVTQNTRVSYPIHHIHNHYKDSTAPHPENVFFLTCDAFGVLPPMSKLTPEQAMYYFISGYTAKVAGTEEGVAEPIATFSACFGAPFLPLHPNAYAQMLGDKIKKHKVKIWLINTGWTGGSYGTGQRIALKHTRAMIAAILNGQLDTASFSNMDIFNLAIPTACPEVPTELLNPRNTWSDKQAYDEQSSLLANMFTSNFEKYSAKVTQDIRIAAPQIAATV